MRTALDIPYTTRSGRTFLMDIFLPGGGAGPFPVVLWIVGGGWRFAGKEYAPDWLTEHGLAVASIEYSVSAFAIAPANIHDCKAAVRFLRANATAYNLDPDRIGAYGGSAGGHLTALLAASAEVPALEGEGGNAGFSSAIQAACDFCGPTDLARMGRPDLRDRFPHLYDVTCGTLGGRVEERLGLARLVSPLNYVSPACPPMFLIHGMMDWAVPVEESILFDDALQKAGVACRMRILETAGHGWDMKSLTDAEVAGFFRRTLRVGK